MWIGSLYKNGPTQHICMSGVHSSTYFSTKLLREVLDTTLFELTNILQLLWSNAFWNQVGFSLSLLSRYFCIALFFISMLTCCWSLLRQWSWKRCFVVNTVLGVIFLCCIIFRCHHVECGCSIFVLISLKVMFLMIHNNISFLSVSFLEEHVIW